MRSICRRSYLKFLESTRFQNKCNSSMPLSFSDFNIEDMNIKIKQAALNLDYISDIKVNDYIKSVYNNLEYYSLNSIRPEKINSIKLSTKLFDAGISDLKQLFKKISQFSNIEQAEISIESDIRFYNNNNIRKLKELGVNRLSILIYTFDNENRKLLGLKGDGKSIQKIIRNLISEGFRNINIQLMYDFNGQKIETLQRDMNIISNLDISGFKLIKSENGKNSIENFAIVTKLAREVCYEYQSLDSMVRACRDKDIYNNCIKCNQNILPLGHGTLGCINKMRIENWSNEKENKIVVRKIRCNCMKDLCSIESDVNKLNISLSKYDNLEKINQLVKELINEDFLVEVDEKLSFTDKGIYWADKIEEQFKEAILAYK
ncbi:MAG: hypothetical protein Q4B52_06720 [Tissierellia bacterium]|nr:hypothetical protein [Tissierellia bacterium]